MVKYMLRINFARTLLALSLSMMINFSVAIEIKASSAEIQLLPEDSVLMKQVETDANMRTAIQLREDLNLNQLQSQPIKNFVRQDEKNKSLVVAEKAKTDEKIRNQSAEIRTFLGSILDVECVSFNQLVTTYQRKFIAPIASWASQHMVKFGTKKVAYLFSGADAVTVLSLFPTADNITLVAAQPLFGDLSKALIPQQIQKECEVQNYFGRFGYFRTNDLEGKESVQPRFIKMLAYSIISSGSYINRIELFKVNDKGDIEIIRNMPEFGFDGLRIHITTSEKKLVLIDYVKINLSNSELVNAPKITQYLSNNLHDTIFLKAASHLLQSPNYSLLADMIVKQSSIIVQDESGLDIKLFSEFYKIKAYGKFERFQKLWQLSPSAKRLSEFLESNSTQQPLPFTLGYEKPKGSLLLIGTRL